MALYEQHWCPSRQYFGARVFFHLWRRSAGATARGTVFVVHGLGEHGGRYAELAAFLNAKGFDVLAPDLPGHGRTRAEGELKKLVSFKDMIEELESVWAFGKALPGMQGPFYLLGHSMGALLGLTWLRESVKAGEDFQKAFFSAPPLRVKMPVPFWKDAMAGWLAKRWPSLEIPNGIDPEGLSYDQDNIRRYKSDPLVHNKASPALYCSLRDEAAKLLAQPPHYRASLFMAVGADDPISDPSAVAEFTDRLLSSKEYALVSGAKHEILQDTKRQEVYALVARAF